LRWQVEPYDTGPALEKPYSSLASDLGQKLGCKVQLIISNSYVAEIEAMRAGHLDIGEFGPLGYILAHQIADAEPVAAFGDKSGQPDTYTAGIWVKKGSPTTTLRDLKGKTVALADTTSTSGGLYPISALINAELFAEAVDGGGIGFRIDNELSIFRFKAVMTYVIVLVVVVLLVERVSTELRARVA
jgi:phosphonate transport system substrate-binding protein